MTSFLVFYGTPLPLLFCLAIVLTALLRPLARAIGGPQGQYWAWCAVPLCLLAASLPAPPVSMAATTPAAVRAVEQVKSQARSVLQLAPQARSSRSAAPTPRPLQIAVAVYGFGALLLCTAFALQHRRWVRKLGWDDARKRWTLPVGFSPAVVGLWRPRLALPLDFEHRFTATEQRLILAHEQVHARRRDTLWNFLATLLLVLNWFNPLAWWALRRFQRDQELACDASALAALGAGARQPYWDALLKAHALSPSSALAHGWRSTHPLIERLRWVKQGVNRRSRVLLASAPLLATVPAFAVYATHGAAVQTMGAPMAAKVGEVRVWLRSQIDGGTWVEDWVDLDPSVSPVAQSTQTLNGKAIYSDVIHIRRAQDGSLAGWVALLDPGSPARQRSPGPPDPNELGGPVAPLQLGAWQATEFKTQAGHRVRLEFRLTAAESQNRHN